MDFSPQILFLLILYIGHNASLPLNALLWGSFEDKNPSLSDQSPQHYQYRISPFSLPLLFLLLLLLLFFLSASTYAFPSSPPLSPPFLPLLYLRLFFLSSSIPTFSFSPPLPPPFLPLFRHLLISLCRSQRLLLNEK